MASARTRAADGSGGSGKVWSVTPRIGAWPRGLRR